ncbi:hypothetical protein FPE01S_01_12200 [Flavihumibacter petaseus NBRC 106054]|uniref:DUF4136 domain-containing protein n=2 Tax=Flavihumibacter TaxID=1004301 RepID=A0A0E9MWS9_9BACT|nr:hypothetical protein FPE01S_01_12200 [Flavihumibacter petaseus NBRC 106054]
MMLWLTACTPSSPEYVSDYDVVYTDYDKNYDFSKVQTYFMPDSVVHSNVGSDQPDHRFDAQILQSLKTNLDALGWTRLSENGPDKADVVVLPTASANAYGSCAAYCWYCDWGWWPGWGYYPPAWGPGWGWGYPPGMICSSYSTGTVFISIAEPDEARADTLPVVWVGILNGLLEGSDANINSRINTNINQMFQQSPYLK